MNVSSLLDFLTHHGEDAEGLLAILANRRRLVILYNLVLEGELAVGELVRRLNIAQSALSQHLALMRAAGIVSTRREGTTIFYSLTDERTRAMLSAIRDVLGPRETGRPSDEVRLAS
ncbi:MAG: metalloregulator ArsR/SmtB family transcription factor [Beijerinckiaceae bacterium]|nr:metalloregulator ArsR/SmtB family transcription factor [Beijerinckiaceae bacterium]